MSVTDYTLENHASQLFHQGHYQEALKLYTAIYDQLQPDGDTRIAVGILLNRSACHLKLKLFEKVLEDCNRVLQLEADNIKAMGRKTKVLCSLGRFTEAHTVAKEWKLKDPHNEQAQKEYQLLEMIIRTLPDQDGDANIEAPLTVSREDNSEHQISVLDNNTNDILIKAHLTTTASQLQNKPCTAGCKEFGSLDDVQIHATSTRVPCSQQSSDKNTTVIEKISANPDNVQPQLVQNSDVKTTCEQCDVNFENVQDYSIHLLSTQHQDRVGKHGKEMWKFRPPPRGLTDKEYSLCAKFTSLRSCPYGSQCTQAHSVSELAEWCERFLVKKNNLKQAQEQGTHSKYKHAEAFLEKLMSTEDPETVMKEDIDGINVHMSSEQKIHLTSKKTSHSWMFTLTTRVSLKHVILLDDTNRKHFHISSITIGPKRQQTPQQIDADCQEWSNPNYTVGKSPNEHVYRIKVLFNTEIYGTFHQSIIFDFGEEPVLLRELCVDSVPAIDVETLKENLIVQEGGRWDLAKIDVVEFEPIPLPYDEMEKALLERYPPPFAIKFIPSPALLQPSLTQENYKQWMHSMLELEEMAWFSNIAKFNIKATLQIVDRFMLMPSSHSEAKFARQGELYAYLKLNGTVSEDTAHGRLVLQNVSTLYLAPVPNHDIHHTDNNSSSKNGSSISKSSSVNSSKKMNKDKNDDQDQNKQPDKVYEAVIEEKGKNFMFIRLSVKCVSELGLKKDTEIVAEIQFHLNRLPVCQMHVAVDELSDMEFIFPTLSADTNIPWTPQKLWKENLDPRLNAKQREAIVAIATDLNIRLPPILIVGPYGTGKTFTLAQATKEVLSQENTRILICTHSNSAADLYIKDYLHPYVENNHPEAIPLRIYYRHRWIETVHPAVKQYCLIGSGSHKNGLSGTTSVFRHPTLEDLEKVRVIVTTLSMSQYLCLDGVQPGFFTHIFLDEAAQVMECESLLPLRLAGPKTRLVLAGDHMQMGPEVHSEFALEREFHVSLLERLYSSYPNQHPCKIQLCENYRSHHAIIDFTSELFYESKLVASGNQPRHDTFYPLTFFTARGEEVQHKNSTTFYNNAEVYEIVERVSEIVKSWPKTWGDIDESSIGVVSPYSDQVQRIRSELRKRKLVNISVERVLNIQGKQYRVILLSTVRTRHSCNTDPSLEDKLDYGFLSNVKLLNTAITRAQSLVAAVGDPVSLSSIGKCRKIWERFLEICNQNGSLYGMSWSHLRAELDGVELKKVYVLNPLAPEFIPNRLRHGPVAPPEPVAYGKYGYMFLTRSRPMVAASGTFGSHRWSRSAVLQTCLRPSANKVFPVHASVNCAGCLSNCGFKPVTVPKCLTPSAVRPPHHGNQPSPNTTSTTKTTTDVSTDISYVTPTSSKSSASPDAISSLWGLSSNEVRAANTQAAPYSNCRMQNVVGAPVYMQNLTQSCTGNPVFMQWSSSLADVRGYPNMAHSPQPVIPANMPYMSPPYVKRPVPLQSAAYSGQPLYSVMPRPVYPSYGIHPVPYICPMMPVHPPFHTASGHITDLHTHLVHGCNLKYQSPGLPPNAESPVLADLKTPSAVVPCASSVSDTSSNNLSGARKQVNSLSSDSSKLDAILSGTGTSFFRKLWLSQELYSYIAETEGERAAAEFIHKLQQGHFYKKKLTNNALLEKRNEDIDIEDSSIIAISRASGYQNKEETTSSSHIQPDVQSDEPEGPLLPKLKEQQQKLIESAYKSTVSQNQQFTGPYSLQNKLSEATDNKVLKPNPDQLRSSSPSQASSASDPLEDTCQVADSIIRFLEESQDDQILRSEFLALDNSSSTNQSHPLYMRGCSDAKQDKPAMENRPLSYASVLQKAPMLKPNVPSTKSPVDNSVNVSKAYSRYTSSTSQLSHGTVQRGITTSVPPDPLDILRNLNIKASPSTQALFDYFA